MFHSPRGAWPINGGCDFLIDPDRSATETAIFWRPELVASVLLLEAAPAVYRTARRLEQLDLTHATLHMRPGGEGAIVLADPVGDHYLVVGAIGPAQPLAVLLPLDDSFHIRAEAALRFQRRLFGRAAGSLPRALALTPRHRVRLVRMVRALDGRYLGASYREIAGVLFDMPSQSATEWKTSPIRAQTIRLVKDAQKMTRGGYLRLLARR
ncbi:DUF2285 domain-containing protein [Elioraea sp.]|uniref:DUF2285 domain-containing protein n=1 Tax=Elioraea sp. TaxID=2185103 RepID=UPI0025C51C7E|nr:DUF2285 domain-containing protein [Elioraea sp.]